ncbi:MAG: hypothetical protein KME13_25975 [Myxacorys californica WJT36-NPBG1]|jgi:hypothetical protein|nr:hypothetical protein [Myxacorys californica WJT36-NPBG1]
MPLPFKVAPIRQYEIIDVGNEEIGILPIKKYENLTRAEYSFIKKQDLYNYQFSLAALAKRISHATGAHFAYVNDRVNAYLFGGFIQNDLVTVEGKEGKITKIETVEGTEFITVSFDSNGDFVSVAGEGIELVSPAWYADYYLEITTLTNEYLESLPYQNYVYATAIITFRLDPNWKLEDTMNPELLDYELVREVASFAYKEKNGWKTEEEAAKEPSTDEELGKSSTEMSNPTGTASSGESSTTGDTTPDSITETSPSSPLA